MNLSCRFRLTTTASSGTLCNVPNLEIAASIFNLPSATILTGSEASFTRHLKAAGYEHMQYMPVRGLHAAVADRLVADGTITSLHQSWMNVQKGSSLKDKLMQAVFPGIEGSMHKIDALEDLAPHDKRLPIIVHPYGQHLGGNPAYHTLDYTQMKALWQYAPLLHQPTAEVLDLWGILDKDAARTAEQLVDAQREHGLEGVALDLHHLTTVRNKINLDQYGRRWRENFVGALAAYGGLRYPSELQVSLRPEFGGDPAHVGDFLGGKFDKTPHGRMLVSIAESLPEDQTDLRVTTEILPSAWQSAGLAWQEGNRKLVQAIQTSPLAG